MEMRDVLDIYKFMETEDDIPWEEINIEADENQLTMKASEEDSIVFEACPTLQKKIQSIYGDQAIAFKVEDLEGDRSLGVYVKRNYVYSVALDLNELHNGEMTVLIEWFNQEKIMDEADEQRDAYIDSFQEETETLQQLMIEEIKNWNKCRMYFATQEIKVNRL